MAVQCAMALPVLLRLSLKYLLEGFSTGQWAPSEEDTERGKKRF